MFKDCCPNLLHMKMKLFATSFLYTIIPFVAAYGKLGHYIIGEVAFTRLSNNTRERIQSCGYLDSFSGSLGNASLWADTIKRNPRYRWTSALHYYDVDNDPPAYCGHVEPPSSARAQNLMNGLSRATANLTCSKIRLKSPVCCGS